MRLSHGNRKSVDAERKRGTVRRSGGVSGWIGPMARGNRRHPRRQKSFSLESSPLGTMADSRVINGKLYLFSGSEGRFSRRIRDVNSRSPQKATLLLGVCLGPTAFLAQKRGSAPAKPAKQIPCQFHETHFLKCVSAFGTLCGVFSSVDHTLWRVRRQPKRHGKAAAWLPERNPFGGRKERCDVKTYSQSS